MFMLCFIQVHTPTSLSSTSSFDDKGINSYLSEGGICAISDKAVERDFVLCSQKNVIFLYVVEKQLTRNNRGFIPSATLNFYVSVTVRAPTHLF